MLARTLNVVSPLFATVALVFSVLAYRASDSQTAARCECEAPTASLAAAAAAREPESTPRTVAAAPGPTPGAPLGAAGGAAPEAPDPLAAPPVVLRDGMTPAEIVAAHAQTWAHCRSARDGARPRAQLRLQLELAPSAMDVAVCSAKLRDGAGTEQGFDPACLRAAVEQINMPCSDPTGRPIDRLDQVVEVPPPP